MDEQIDRLAADQSERNLNENWSRWPVSLTDPLPAQLTTPSRSSRFTFDKALRFVRSMPADIAFRTINLPPVSFYLEERYRRALRDFAQPLTEIESAAVAGLHNHGVFITDIESLGLSSSGDDDIMAAGTCVANLLATGAASFGEARPAVVASKPDHLLRFPTVYRWGLNSRLLRIVEAYQRLPVAYDGPLVFHAQADGRETASRKWHLDREDRRVIKVALYLHDVTDDGGPFQLLNCATQKDGESIQYSATDTAGLIAAFGEATVSRNTITCPGKAGTVIFAETGRFYHRGKPATRNERSTIFFSYFSRRPRHPFYCSRSQLSRKHILELTKGLSPEQKACALWQDELPLIARIVPPSVM
jgi:hypothetical protein